MRSIRTIVQIVLLAVTLYAVENQNSVASKPLFDSKYLPVVYQNSGYLTVIGEAGKLQNVSLTTADGTTLYEVSTQKDYVNIPIAAFNFAESVCFIRIKGQNGNITKKVLLR